MKSQMTASPVKVSSTTMELRNIRCIIGDFQCAMATRPSRAGLPKKISEEFRGYVFGVRSAGREPLEGVVCDERGRGPQRQERKSRLADPREPGRKKDRREKDDHQEPRWNRLDEDDEESEEEQEHDERVEGRRGQIRDQRHPRRRYRGFP